MKLTVHFTLLWGWLLSVFPALAFGQMYSAVQGIQNSNPLCLIFENFTASNATCGTSSQNKDCYSLSPGGQEWVTIQQQGGWISLNFQASSYDVIKKTCNKDNLGGINISFSDDGKPPRVTTYNNEQTKVYTVNQQNKLYGLYFFPTVVPTFPTPSSYTSVPYRGINLSGAEFDAPSDSVPTAYDAWYFIQCGMNTVRIPFRWEYLQPPSQLNTAINFNQGYGKQLIDLVKALVAAKIVVILDMHNYMRYPLNAGSIDGPIIGLNSKATVNDYANAWQQIATQLVQANVDSNYVMLDLMNEPWSSSTSSLPTPTILANYNAAMVAIRETGFRGLLLLEGNAFSGALDWSKNYYGIPNSQVFVPSAIKDPLNNYAINVHQYLGPDQNPTTGICISSTTLLSDKNFYTFVNWLKQYQLPAILTETGGIPTSSCYSDIDVYLSAVEANPYQPGIGGFIGWLGWTGGHAWYLVSDNVSDKQLFIAPDTNGNERPQMMQGFQKHLTSTELK